MMKNILILTLFLSAFSTMASEKCLQGKDREKYVNRQACQINEYSFWQTPVDNTICKKIALARFQKNIYKPSLQKDYCTILSSDWTVLARVLGSKKLFLKYTTSVFSQAINRYVVQVRKDYVEPIERGCMEGFQVRKKLELACDDDNHVIWEAIEDIKQRTSR